MQPISFALFVTGVASDIFQPEWSGVDFMLAGANYPNGWAEIDFVTLAADAETPPIVDDYVDHIMESGGGSIYAGFTCGWVFSLAAWKPECWRGRCLCGYRCT